MGRPVGKILTTYCRVVNPIDLYKKRLPTKGDAPINMGRKAKNKQDPLRHMYIYTYMYIKKCVRITVPYLAR